MPKFNLQHDRHRLIQLLALERPAPWNPRPHGTYKRAALADPSETENTKEKAENVGIEANNAAKTYISFLQDEVQRLKDEEDRDRWIMELMERNEFLEKEIQRLKEQIKKLSDEEEQETEK
ncbi:unnamed protein product [Fusarium fujikuroi]|uniref:Uncharacterized protein n=1 Tax=Fusarium fujikuroi TaxID=5127 RepID=A0A9Q9RRK6_FUSFU|nr:uncharacterized protein FFM5_10972 [Fusarium fujikuroi]VTT68179.1 unnamed protein product [Fusarium fujikuroi]VTT76286.1 unnamed protein product [Fusarium fujikuroi]